MVLGSKASGQNAPDLAGVYNRSFKGDPHGASYLFVLEGHRYIITYFGGAQIGSWKMAKEHIVEFTPDVSPHPFVIYGRHNPMIGDSTRIFFNGFEEEETFIHPGPIGKEKPLMQRVFNKDPNCFGFPYVHKFAGIKTDLSFVNIGMMDFSGEGPRDIYTFQNEEKYNDFAAYYFEKKQEDRPFYAMVKDGKLYFDEEDYAEKHPLPETGEDAEFIRSLAGFERIPEEVFYNPYYGTCENAGKDTLNYEFHEAKNAYISPLNYTEGEELVKGDNAFNTCSIVYAFKKLSAFSVTKRVFEIDEKPLFQVSCEDR